MNELPDEISLIIYSYVGNNFIINKTFYNLIKRIRRRIFIIIQYNYIIGLQGGSFQRIGLVKENMVNTLNARIRPNMKVV